MKSRKSNWILPLGIISASVLAASITARADLGNAVSPLESLDNMEVAGKVTAKTDTSLLVDGKPVVINETTSFTKEGRAIKLGDIQVGDHVKVTTSKGTNGEITALRVEVVPSKSGG